MQTVKRGLDHGVWAGFVVGMIALMLQMRLDYPDADILRQPLIPRRNL